MNLQDQLRRFMAPLTSRVRLMVARGVVKLVDDARKMQSLQVSVQADVVRDKVERFQEYGFTSVPLKDAEAILLAVGGNTAHLVCVAVDDRRYRPTTGLAPGDVGMYRLNEGFLVKLLAGQNVELGPSPTQYVALANLVKQEIDKLQAYLSTLHTVLMTSVNEPGAGAPSAFQAAIAIALTPYASGVPTIAAPAATKVKAK